MKLVVPKGRTPTNPTATLTADITDQGGGVGAVVVENNGVRLAIPMKTEPATGGNSSRVTFTVSLMPGVNRIGVRAATRDGSRESAASEVELSLPKAPGQRGRLYVVAVGISDYAEKGWNLPSAKKDAKSVAGLLQGRGGNLFDRIDVVPVFDREATRTTIEDTVRDVAELSRPHDTVAVMLCGRGGVIDEKVYFAPHDLRVEQVLSKGGVPVDSVAAALGAARALNRVLVVDAAGFGVDDQRGSKFGLRGTVERWGRSHGVHSLVAVGSSLPTLARSLSTAAGGDTSDVTDWLRSAADRATSPAGEDTRPRPNVQVGTRAKGFPLLAGGK